jgi:hypothetical protein
LAGASVTEKLALSNWIANQRRPPPWMAVSPELAAAKMVSAPLVTVIALVPSPRLSLSLHVP